MSKKTSAKIRRKNAEKKRKRDRRSRDYFKGKEFKKKQKRKEEELIPPEVREAMKAMEK